MTGVLDAEIDQLLCEAEGRLQGAAMPVAQASSQPRLKASSQPADQEYAKPSKTTDNSLAVQPGKDLSVRILQPGSASKAAKKDTAGKNWFDLPKTELTPEFRRDWQLLRMRGLLDPKHQKKTLRAVAPEYSQIGEVIAGPADFYSGRLTRKERKKTLLEEVTAEHNAVKLNSKYAGIQRTKSSGRKAFYQKLVSQRRKARR